jgi:glycosyltransferase involved in cell wall biosynthesis
VIDDGSTDGTREMIKELKTDSNLRYFYQENQGWASSRNSGIKKAKGEIVAFIDADCVADKNWLYSIWTSYQKAEEKVAGIGGLTFVKPGKQKIIAKIDQEILNYHIRKFKKGNEVFFLPTSNLSFKKVIFTKIGYFDTDLNAESGEDTEFCWRTIKNNYKLIYEPKIKVEHFQRNNLISFILQNFTYGKGIYLVRKKYPDFCYIKSDPLSDLKRYFHELFIFPFLFTKLFPKWPEKITALFLASLRQVTFFIGLISGKIKYG